jgi:hypothetical protein
MPKNIEHGNRHVSEPVPLSSYPFAEQKDRMGLFIRTIGRSRPRQVKIGVGNLAYNLKRFVWWQGRSVTA